MTPTSHYNKGKNNYGIEILGSVLDATNSKNT